MTETVAKSSQQELGSGDTLLLELFDQIEKHRNALSEFDSAMTDGYIDIIEASREGRVHGLNINSDSYGRLEEMKPRLRMNISQQMTMKLVNLEDEEILAALSGLSVANVSEDQDHSDVEEAEENLPEGIRQRKVAEKSSTISEESSNSSEAVTLAPVKTIDTGSDIMEWFSVASNYNMKSAQDHFVSSLDKLNEFYQQRKALENLLLKAEALFLVKSEKEDDKSDTGTSSTVETTADEKDVKIQKDESDIHNSFLPHFAKKTTKPRKSKDKPESKKYSPFPPEQNLSQVDRASESSAFWGDSQDEDKMIEDVEPVVETLSQANTNEEIEKDENDEVENPENNSDIDDTASSE